MFDALYIAATGMQAQQLNIDTIANNLANLNTTGFKRARVSFGDLVARDAPVPAAVSEAQVAGATGLLATTPRIGCGVGIEGVAKVFDLGDVKQTGSAFDVAIRGDGLFEVEMPDGTHAYTRGGTLKVNADGLLCSSSGYPIQPGVTVPADATGLSIGTDGRVHVSVPNQSTPIEVGQLQLVRFANPGGLTAQGNDQYQASDASGEPIAAKPGEDGIGTLAQGYLEGSNVKLIDEMINLMLAQRAYEASVKLVQASDEVLGLVNALRK